MKRRAFMAGLGGMAAWPGFARAQQAMPTVGFLDVRGPDDSRSCDARLFKA